VTSAGLVLAGTFAVFAVAGGSSQIQQIGIGIAVGVLMDTFLVRTLLVPSTVVLLGRWNWWPSKLARKSEPELEEHRPVPVRMDGGGGGFATPISGHVRRSVGGTIGRAIMTLIDPSGRQVGRAVSGDGGRYQLAAPGTGAYVLIASSASGHQPQASTVTVGSWPTIADVVLRDQSPVRHRVSGAHGHRAAWRDSHPDRRSRRGRRVGTHRRGRPVRVQRPAGRPAHARRPSRRLPAGRARRVGARQR
jgi:hypothetical protein